MTQENFILLSPNSIKWLEEKFQALEEKISNQKSSPKSAKNDWIPLKDFMEEIGVKSHYSVSKLESVAEARGIEFKSEFRGKRRYIHRSEIEKYFQGVYE
ncbi:hypothetical protein MM239_11070 [Belliella sp. DSM 111904]|uniref:Helix-turn-helix domain-containing protein n=1 Tax=Belliella filtrata TaxID=2923435 RepID=A0ABS9V0K0_9BACT|nr:hypothetical protein [Belliella filtrata]MCH7409936.1 hypothetical protein [Belliella filtrata]